ncbi:MAG: GTP 3',8-cyclase MoaA [Deltaproteobacteria bacterium]|nr:GTP 3',8-cyclase MoaA [Deltaproteobacteria bacterium]
MQDGFGRDLHYLRLSVTERCNFRCAYCLPEGCRRPAEADVLSADELDRLVRAFSRLGFWKLRITGGEPTLRSDIVDVVGRLARVPGIRRLGLTTNGSRLLDLAPALRAAGLTALNVSLDSLDPERFARVTGVSGLESIVAGVEKALEVGIPSVKVNVVLLRGLEDLEIDRFLEWTRRLPLHVRFIELMQTGNSAAFFRSHHLPAHELRQKLEQRGWAALPKDSTDGPATMLGHLGHPGKVGVIAPYSNSFCSTCNRIRVSASGALRLCLFGNQEIPLRPALQPDAGEDALDRLIESTFKAKPQSHLLDQETLSVPPTFAAIGG